MAGGPDIDLATVAHQGRTAGFLFFWGHQPRRDGRIGRACLSQWWQAPFTVDGVTFATAEHYMMWAKAMLFDDRTVAEQVLGAADPQAAKALGRRVAGFDEPTWRAHRFDVVVTGNLAKFDQHPPLAAFLLGTGDQVLVEASPVDRVWGIGLAADHPDAGDPQRWRGENLLGFALMRVRTMLRDQAG